MSVLAQRPWPERRRSQLEPRRLYFTSFPNPPPRPEVLNRLATEPDYAPRIRATAAASSSAITPDDDAKYYYFTIDDQLLYLSFFQDWGPLNLAMVYKACILIHELFLVRTSRCHSLGDSCPSGHRKMTSPRTVLSYTPPMIHAERRMQP